MVDPVKTKQEVGERWWTLSKPSRRWVTPLPLLEKASGFGSSGDFHPVKKKLSIHPVYPSKNILSKLSRR